MNVGKFWLLMFLAMVIATLIFLEIACEMQVDSLSAKLSNSEAKLNQARQASDALRLLIQKIAIESQRDPALLQLLTKRGISFAPRAPGATGGTLTPATGLPQPPPAPTSATPSTP